MHSRNKSAGGLGISEIPDGAPYERTGSRNVEFDEERGYKEGKGGIEKTTKVVIHHSPPWMNKSPLAMPVKYERSSVDSREGESDSPRRSKDSIDLWE
jgi:hypothetical protein